MGKQVALTWGVAALLESLVLAAVLAAGGGVAIGGGREQHSTRCSTGRPSTRPCTEWHS
jgi:hypothetical protein